MHATRMSRGVRFGLLCILLYYGGRPESAFPGFGGVPAGVPDTGGTAVVEPPPADLSPAGPCTAVPTLDLLRVRRTAAMSPFPAWPLWGVFSGIAGWLPFCTDCCDMIMPPIDCCNFGGEGPGFSSGVSAAAQYGQSELKPSGDERTIGATLAAIYVLDRLALLGALSYSNVAVSGVNPSPDHSALGAHAQALYRALDAEQDGVDVVVSGLLDLTYVKYENEIAGSAEDTFYAAPGAGVTAGRWLRYIGYLEAAYYYQNSIALIGGRQPGGDRSLSIHSAGLGYSVPVLAGGGNSLWLGLQGLYQYVPGLPSGMDGDSITMTGLLEYRRKNGGAGLRLNRTFGDDQLGANWAAEVRAYRRF